MVLALYAGPVNQGLGVSCEPGEGACDVAVNLDDLLDAGGLHEGTSDPLLHGQDHTLASLDPDGSGAELNGLDGVLNLASVYLGIKQIRICYTYADLEKSPLRRKGVRPAVILGSVEEHG